MRQRINTVGILDILGDLDRILAGAATGCTICNAHKMRLKCSDIAHCFINLLGCCRCLRRKYLHG